MKAIYRCLVSATLFLLINVLFIDKYSLRFTEWHWLFDIIYLVAGAGLIGLTVWLQKQEGPFRILLWVGIAVYTIVAICVQYSIDPMSLQVDRWSAIHHFLDNLFQGIYPYAAQTHLGGYGSPFPIWQLLHIPFYLLGNVGLSFFAVLVFFLYTLSRCESYRTAFIALLWIICSPAINYEVVVRSDLFTNFMLMCAICEWLRYKNVSLDAHLYSIAILAGLCSSTRFAAVIPLAFLYGFSFLKLDFRKQLGFASTTIGIFALTFAPFAIWDIDQMLFFQYNPFVLQTRQGGSIAFLLFTIVAIGWTLYQKDHLQHYFLHTGGLLMILVVIAFASTMIRTGNYYLYSSQYDITYFNMTLPFYLCAIAIRSTP